MHLLVFDRVQLFWMYRGYILIIMMLMVNGNYGVNDTIIITGGYNLIAEITLQKYLLIYNLLDLF